MDLCVVRRKWVMKACVGGVYLGVCGCLWVLRMVCLWVRRKRKWVMKACVGDESVCGWCFVRRRGGEWVANGWRMVWRMVWRMGGEGAANGVDDLISFREEMALFCFLSVLLFEENVVGK